MKKIKNIVLYDLNQNDIYTEQACIFYSDGDVESVSKEKCIELISVFAEQNNIKNMDDLKNNEHIKILSEKEFENEYDNILNNSKEETIDNNLDKTDELIKEDIENNNYEYKSNDYRKFWFTLKLGLGIGAIVLGTKVVKSIINYNSSSKEYNIDNIKDNKNNFDIENNNKTGKLLNDNTLNEEKRMFITTVWSYLNQYNNDFSSLHLSEESTTKLALTWDEVIAEELIYNNIDKEALTQIFDSYNFNAEDMYNAYLNAISQETEAHIVQTTPLNKTLMFNNDEGKSFYEKYETMMINFNNETEDNKKEEIANDFYLNLRNDFDIKDIDSIKSYKLSIIPIINAMNMECRNLDKDYLLTEEEKNFFNKKIPKKIVKKKLEEYEKVLNTYAIADKALNNNAISFEAIKQTAIEDLEGNNSYNIEENQRDISDHKEYIDRINWKYTKNSSNSNFNLENSENNNNNNEKENNDKKEQEKKKKKNNQNKEVISSPVPTSDNNNNDSISNNNNSNDNNNNNNNSIEQNQTTSDDDNYQIPTPIPADFDGDSPDDVNEETPEPFKEDEQTEEPVVNNTPTPTSDNSIKDITTDPTGAVDSNEPLPDPNNITIQSLTTEELVDIIINQMEKQEDDNTYQKTYVK